MNVNELYEAIGQADPALVEHSERTVRRSRGRAVRIALTAAALLAVMSVTVAASPGLQQLLGLRAVQSDESEFLIGPHIAFAKTANLQLRPELENTEQAPKTIETRYVPMELAEHWEPQVLEVEQSDGAEASAYENLLKDSETRLLFYRDGQSMYALFGQYAIGGRTAEDLDLSVNLGFGSNYSIETLQFGALSAQLVTVPPSEIARSQPDPNGQSSASYASFTGAQYCYWTDGSYLYSLETGVDLPRQTLRDIVTSLAPVEDITVYMPLRFVEPEPTQSYPLPDRIYRPAYLPGGFVLTTFAPDPDKTLTQVFTNEELGITCSLVQYSKPYSSVGEVYSEDARDTAVFLNGQDFEISEVRLGDRIVTVEYAASEGLLYMRWDENDCSFELISLSGIGTELLPELYRMIESMTPDE